MGEIDLECFLKGDIWSQVNKLVDGRNTHTRAAIAYVGLNMRYTFGEDDILLCDASEASIRARRTSAKALGEIWDSGANIYSVPRLHAKCLVAGAFSVIGSANLSDNSANNLVECAYLTDRKQTQNSVLAFLDDLLTNRKALTKAEIIALGKLPLDPIPPSKKFESKGDSVTKSAPPRVWVMGTKPFDIERASKTEQAAVGKIESKLPDDVGYVRLSGASRMREKARKGDWLIELSGESSGGKIEVEPPIRLVSCQKAPKWTRLYFGNRGDSKLSLATLNKLLVKAKLKPLVRWSTRELNRDYIRALAKVYPELSK